MSRLYYEAHITVRPDGPDVDWNEFVKLAEENEWRASRFDVDEVDHYDGAWFLSARDNNYYTLMGRVRKQVDRLGDFEFIRAKIEDTLFDTKHGDRL